MNAYKKGNVCRGLGLVSEEGEVVEASSDLIGPRLRLERYPRLDNMVEILPLPNTV